MDIQEFRKQYPQYNHVPDANLAQALHKKYYSHVPFETFVEKFGLTLKTPQIGPQGPNAALSLGSTQKAIIGDVRGLGGQEGIYSEAVDPQEQAEYEKLEWLQEQINAGNIEPVPPSFWEKFKEDIPQMAGGTIGGLTGAKAGALAGAKIPGGHPYLKGAAILGGAALGAGVGGMGGKGYQQFYRITRPKARSMPLKEIYAEQTIAGIEEAAAELAGRGIAKIGGKLLRPIAKRLEPGAKGLSQKLLRAGKKIGIKAPLTPAQATESRLVDTLEGMAEKSFLGGGKLQRLKRIYQPKAFAQYIDDVVEEISRGAQKELSSEELGDVLLRTINEKNTAFKATAKAAYNKVDKFAGGAEVSLIHLKTFAKKTMKTAAARKGIGATQAGDALLKKVLQLDDTIPFRQAQALRSAFLDERRAMALTKDKALGLAKQFIKLSDDAMEEGAKKLSPEALKAWRIANKFYRTGRTQFDKKIIRTLTKQLVENPEVAIKKIFQPNASRQINVVKGIVDKKTWTTLKTGYLEAVIRDSASTDGTVLGETFLKRLNRMGEPTLKEIFNQQELTSIRSIGRLAQLTQKATGGSGGMLVQLMQAGAVVNFGRILLGGGPQFAGESAAVVIGPPVLSRMLANPTWAQWLSAGFRMPATAKNAGPLAARLLKTYYKVQRQQKEDQESQRRETVLKGLRELPPYRGY